MGLKGKKCEANRISFCFRLVYIPRNTAAIVAVVDIAVFVIVIVVAVSLFLFCAHNINLNCANISRVQLFILLTKIDNRAKVHLKVLKFKLKLINSFCINHFSDYMQIQQSYGKKEN